MDNDVINNDLINNDIINNGLINNDLMDNDLMDNDLMITLKAIKILNNTPYFNNDKICDLYKRLFEQLYSSQNQNTLFIKIWLNYITEQLSRTADLLTHCEAIINDNNSKDVDTIRTEFMNDMMTAA